MVTTIVTSFDRRLTLIVADVSVAVYWPRNVLVINQVVNNVSTATQKQLVSRPNILFVYIIHFLG